MHNPVPQSSSFRVLVSVPFIFIYLKHKRNHKPLHVFYINEIVLQYNKHVKNKFNKIGVHRFRSDVEANHDTSAMASFSAINELR